MILTLAAMGWREGAEPSWMLTKPGWREWGLAARSVCGFGMLSVSALWLLQWKSS
jgi:hypothetical protein